MSRVEFLLEKTLSGWRGWRTSWPDEPRVVRELLGGRTNRSFLVKSGAYQAVVRINNEDSISLGINRHQEIEILSLLQEFDFSPKVLFVDSHTLVSDYIEGYQWLESDLNAPLNIKKVTKIINKIHSVSLPCHAVKRNYLSYCQYYIRQLPVSICILEKLFFDELLHVAAAIDSQTWAPVINHHDIVPGNLIEATTGLFLIDWEYAAFGHPEIDLVRLHGLSDKISITEKIFFLQQGLDRLWSLVQS